MSGETHHTPEKTFTVPFPVRVNIDYVPVLSWTNFLCCRQVLEKRLLLFLGLPQLIFIDDPITPVHAVCLVPGDLHGQLFPDSGNDIIIDAFDVS